MPHYLGYTLYIGFMVLKTGVTLSRLPLLPRLLLSFAQVVSNIY